MSTSSPWPLSAAHDDQSRNPISPVEEMEEPQYAARSTAGNTPPPFGAPAGVGSPPTMSAGRSVSPPSVFDTSGEQQEYETQPTTTQQDDDEPGSYDLKPPAPSVQHQNIEYLSGRLFSEDHLDAIIRDPQTQARFKAFLKNYQQEHQQTLARYIETKKAVAAIEYANAIAEGLPTKQGHPPFIAAQLDDRFDARSRQIVEDLVEEAVPAYITTRLVQLVTESLVKDITGNNAPIMRELVPNLAEVYCITDPALPDNPIVYASEEFYNTTQYGKDYVIGRNCRFLQGPKTSERTVKRMIEALTEGQEICETILNYRRDGSPFMNLLLIAPLYDNKGQVRYFLGSQIDVSPLIEGGRGLESFSKLLSQDRADSRFGHRPTKEPKHILEEFSSLLSAEERDVVMHRARNASRDSDKSAQSSMRGKRRVIGMDDPDDMKGLWPHLSLGRSGRLPGVYQNYLLVRPYPSLRITFTSPALRIPGLLQTKFLERIGGPNHVRESIQDAMQQGTGVTAKISWLTTTSGSDERDSIDGKPRWIHCTPMLGSDDRVGVWMIVMVEQEEVTGRLNRTAASSTYTSQRAPPGVGVIDNSGLMSPAGARSPAPVRTPMGSGGGGPPSIGRDAGKMTGNKLYAEYLRREGRDAPTDRGRPMTRGTDKTSSTAKEQRDVDQNFRNF